MAAVEPLKPRVTVREVVPPPAVTCICSASMSNTSLLAMLAPELTVIVVCAAVMLALRVVVISTVAPLAWLALDDPLKSRSTVNDVVPPPGGDSHLLVIDEQHVPIGYAGARGDRDRGHQAVNRGTQRRRVPFEERRGVAVGERDRGILNPHTDPVGPVTCCPDVVAEDVRDEAIGIIVRRMGSDGGGCVDLKPGPTVLTKCVSRGIVRGRHGDDVAGANAGNSQVPAENDVAATLTRVKSLGRSTEMNRTTVSLLLFSTTTEKVWAVLCVLYVGAT